MAFAWSTERGGGSLEVESVSIATLIEKLDTVRFFHRVTTEQNLCGDSRCGENHLKLW